MRRRRRGQAVVTSVSGPDALIRDGEPPPTMHSGHGLCPRSTIQYTARSKLPMRYTRDRNVFDLAASAQQVFEKLRLQSVEELPADKRPDRPRCP